jgi:hypothetical protein
MKTTHESRPFFLAAGENIGGRQGPRRFFLPVLASILLAVMSVPAGAQTLATMIFPTNGATINPTGNTFSWNSVSDGQAYYLYIGSAPGLKDVFNSGALIATSITVPNFGVNTTYYIRLWTEINGHWGSNYVDSTFSTIPNAAVLISPANGATGVNPNPSVTFTWNSVTGATYTLALGSTPGASDVYQSGSVSTTSVSVANLKGLATFYVTLTTVTSKGNSSSSSSFTTTPVLAQLSYPLNGASNVPLNNPTFTWSSVSDGQAYYLYIGTSAGANNVLNSGAITATSIGVPNLQLGTRYYARLWTEINGHWSNYYVDTSFTTVAATAYVIFPANGATNVDPYLTISWNSVTGAQSYSVNIGTAPGGSDVFSSGAVTSTSLYVPGLKPNTTYYATLLTNTTGGTNSSASSFTTGTGIAHLMSPADSATNVSPFAPFTWTNISGAQAYYYYVGTTPTARDVENTGALPPSQSSRLTMGLIGAQTYYVQLYTEKAGLWFSVTTSFTTAPQPIPTDATAYRSNIQSITNSVRMMTQGMTNTPIPGTLLAQITTADGQTYALCTEYARTLLQEFLTQNVSARIRHVVFDGSNLESHTISEYYDLLLNKWIVADSDFGAVYFNTSTQTGMGVEDISANVEAQNWTAISNSIIYVSTYGKQVFTTYYMDPILLYLNVLAPAASSPPNPLPNSPVPFFIVDSSSSIGVKGHYVFSFANQTDSVTISDPMKGILTLKPASGSTYAGDIGLNTGWTITASPSGLGILQIARVMF